MNLNIEVEYPGLVSLFIDLLHAKVDSFTKFVYFRMDNFIQENYICLYLH